jgi:hypothetical protein
MTLFGGAPIVLSRLFNIDVNNSASLKTYSIIILAAHVIAIDSEFGVVGGQRRSFATPKRYS